MSTDSTLKAQNTSGSLDSMFKITERKTTIGTELYAGFITFLAMSYILAVNPAILGGIPGMDKGAVFTATALAAAISTLIMGIWGNYPVMLAPGMSMNGFFKGLLLSGSVAVLWNEALFGIFLSGILYLAFSLTNIRKSMIESIPEDLKLAITVSLGLFIAFLGLKNAGIIVSNPFVLVGLGDISDPKVIIAYVSIFIALGCMIRDIKLATFISFVSAIVLTILADVFMGTSNAPIPEQLVAMPPSMAGSFGAIFDFSAFTPEKMFDLLFIVLIFLIVDFFDGLSTIVGVGRDAGIIDKDGKVPNAKSALVADAGGTVIGSILGTTSITAFSESGIASSQGAKTGLAAVMVAGLFLISLFLYPIFSIFSAAMVAPAMVVVGIYMVGRLGQINWEKKESRIAAFFTIMFTVLSFSPANGMAMGFISYAFTMVVAGKRKEVHPLIYGLCVVFLTYLILL
ncbi:putative MFS transporter, AGZA family, xanthine/uracil permease [Vibrio crassostreae]|uniref:AGZA family xanthine/uracil permease-like MFS transporter n=1 Tax=Vibrio crassostreae TaxID=246167 RepID=A0A822N7D5_9VIBR|nr:NCS2 family permease [Vibrio crassostreae]MDH5950732.1 NCS2 family permease [Vibrio crassostreae]TCN07088.1 AGZA family xanthine/uracil permease-like MFS transporter [Vibrio crassostreae]TCU07466.1 AGZA family xanthine/uracil permease-like MFS transporter [Vibrio crassostreae]CAK2201148.1 putative MFS transporter, AGZA family, xanthine/uracil permease [Vibrio crassostreae]CAK2218696.1 putative MFS transporter, AGZA family, xanthine/uracil permease [Vibrio crassostreae]